MSTSSANQPFRFSIDAIGGLPHGARNPNDFASADEGLLRETRQELRRLVSDVASLCHSRIDPNRFWPKFLNLVGTAIAAEAGIIWCRTIEPCWEPIAHCGALDKRLLIPRAAPSHDSMIREIGDAGGPVAVPPGADWDADEPGNPSHSLAAVVPVPIDPDEPVKWLLELFLPAGAGPATQRGYLRFLAQMTDLAAEYLRAERLRSVSRAADFSQRAALMLAMLQELTGSNDFHTHLVDAFAQFTGAERVSLVLHCDATPKVIAVNGVAKLDRFSSVLREIAQIADLASDSIGLMLAEPHETAPAAELSNATAKPGNSANIEVVESGSLVLRGVLILEPSTRHRIVIEDAQPRTTPVDELERWKVLARQISGLLNMHQQQTSGGMLRLFTSSRHGRRSLLRRSLVPLALASILIIGSMTPVPLVITAKGHLQPASQQVLYAPRAAVVSEIHVFHDQQVKQGQPILQLEDAELLQQIEQLTSRLAILAEQAATVQDEQTRASGRDARLLEELALQQRSIHEEVRSLRSQLDICGQIQASLTLYAACDGRIDAWQLENNLANRPVERGQPLLRIIPENPTWHLHTQLPQNRLDHFVALIERQKMRAADVKAQFVMTAFPDIQLDAILVDLGPVAPQSASATTNGAEQAAFAIASFGVDAEKLPLQQSGAPVDVGISCGYRPLAYVLCQDLMRLASQTFLLYK